MDASAPTSATGSECDNARCPLCGGPNGCQLTTTGAYKGLCWCERTQIPESLLARVPAELQRRVCICARCVEQELGRAPAPEAEAGDFYRDGATGAVVFTEGYHRRRGYCCGNGCRHCPFDHCAVPGKGGGLVATIAGQSAMMLALLIWLLALMPQAGHADVVTEEFATDPFARGWQVVGDTNLCQWDAVHQNVAVTWDSSRSNSFLMLPLGTELTTADDFAFSFDLQLADAAVRDPENRPAAVQIGLGLVRQSRLPDGNPTRLAGTAQDLVEFDWFADSFIPGFGDNPATIGPAVFGANGSRAFSFNNFFDLSDGATWRVRCAYAATNRQLTITLLRDGVDAGPVNPVKLATTFQSFTVDAFAVIAWSENGTTTDSLLAHGTLDHVVLELPDTPIGALTLVGLGAVEFSSLTGWHYTLEASGDLQTWAGTVTADGTGGRLQLADPRDVVLPRQFYRVRAARP